MGASLKRDDRRLQAIFQFIVQYKAANDGVAPTLREIADAVQINSSSLIAYYLRIMAGHGMIRMIGDGTPRGIIVPGGSWVYCDQPPAPN